MNFDPRNGGKVHCQGYSGQAFRGLPGRVQGMTVMKQGKMVIEIEKCRRIKLNLIMSAKGTSFNLAEKGVNNSVTQE